MAQHPRVFVGTLLIPLMIISSGITASSEHVPTLELPTVDISSGITASSEHVPTLELPTLDNSSSITVDTIVDYIFEKYSTDTVLSFEGYEHLLESLSLGVIHIRHSVDTHLNNPSAEFMEFHKNHQHPLETDDPTDDHGHADDHDHTDIHADDHDHTDNHTDDHDHTNNHVDDHDHTDEHEHPTQDSMRAEHFTDDSSSEKDDTHANRKIRDVREQQVGTMPQELLNTCLRPMDILQLLRFTDLGLTKTQFKELCPLLIAQIDGHTCDQLRHHSRTHDNVHGQEENSLDTSITTETWLYACGAIVVISLSGLICVGLLSLLHHMFVENFLHFLVAMAVGALTGDAMLHLLPHALSSSEGDAHGTADVHDMEGVYKGLAGLASFYFFFLFGRIQSIASSKKLKKKRKEIDDVDSVGMTMVIRSPDDKDNVMLEKVVSVKSNEVDIPEKEHRGHSHGHSHGHDHDETPGSTGAMVWRVIVGDGIHNFSDGLAIGVAFAVSLTSGLSTSIAVLCHELPHEIGDFAVLLKKGMSIKQALSFNCLSSALSLIGVLAGVAIGNFTSIKVYILVCVAGMFIYISLVDMLPEISSSPAKNPVRHLVFTMLGLGVGSGIMLTIALKEGELKQITT